MLVLHGEAADGALMRKILELTGWLAELRSHGVKVEFLDAPHAVSPLPGLYEGLAAAGEYNKASYFGWGLVTEDETRHAAASHDEIVRQVEPGRELTAKDEASRAAAASESVRHVERWIETQPSPVGGICGISDGALIAAAVAARSPSLKMFINFCSRQWELLPTSMDLEVPQLITVPSLHVLGRADTLLSPAQLGASRRAART